MRFVLKDLVLQGLLAATASSALQVVTVGKDGTLLYSPETIIAPVGSQVEFQFYGPVHSVVQAAYEEPCQAINNGTGFFAGFKTPGDGPNNTTFTLTVNNTDPIWFYCAFPGHCSAGMVGVINPNSNSGTLETFRSKAANTQNVTTPPQQQGGLFGPYVAPSGISTSSSSTTVASTSASSPTKASGTATATKTPSGVDRVSVGVNFVLGAAVAVAGLMV